MAPLYLAPFWSDVMLVALCSCVVPGFRCHLECRPLLTLLGMS